MKKKRSWQEKLKKRLEAEGHKVIRKGRSKHYMVRDYEKALVNT